MVVEGRCGLLRLVRVGWHAMLPWCSNVALYRMYAVCKASSRSSS